MTVYARCIEVKEPAPEGFYTAKKDYEAFLSEFARDFDIIADNGVRIFCSWQNDIDCIWERVEY